VIKSGAFPSSIASATVCQSCQRDIMLIRPLGGQALHLYFYGCGLCREDNAIEVPYQKDPSLSQRHRAKPHKGNHIALTIVVRVTVIDALVHCR